MVSIEFIRENPEKVQQSAIDKLIDVDIKKLLEVDARMRTNLVKIEALRKERNDISKDNCIPNEEKGVKVRAIKAELSVLEEQYDADKKVFDAIISTVPSVPVDGVPVGKNEDDNIEVRRVGEIPKFDFEVKDHFALMQDLDMVDTKNAIKFAGSRAYLLKGDVALLEMAVIRYATDKLVQKGFTPYCVPVMVKQEAMYGTGYFPLGYDQTYKINEDGLYLVGTSEVSLVSVNKDEIIDPKDFPIRMAGVSTCFRREAGSAGRDVYGLYRVHQFQKVEQVVLCKADDNEMLKLHEEILNNAEEILQDFGLPYRVVLSCTGELGIGQVKKYDIETWMPSRGNYCETHSASAFRDFQARRSNIRYRDEDGKLKFAYTLNNTAIASPRILIPLLEMYQQADGSIAIPEVLQPYMNGRKFIGKKEN